MSKRLSIEVTDHAIVRYLERVGGFEIDKLRHEIAARLSGCALQSDCSVMIDGYRYILRREEMGDGLVLTTIIDPDYRKSMAGKQ